MALGACLQMCKQVQGQVPGKEQYCGQMTFSVCRDCYACTHKKLLSGLINDGQAKDLYDAARTHEL